MGYCLHPPSGDTWSSKGAVTQEARRGTGVVDWVVVVTTPRGTDKSMGGEGESPQRSPAVSLDSKANAQDGQE